MRYSKIIEFPVLLSHSSLLGKLKNITNNSSHSHEQAANDLLCFIEESAKNGEMKASELSFIAATANDILHFFKYDIEELQNENNWYRASVIHQISCGILQTIRLIRPDLSGNHALSESAYEIYRYQESFITQEPRSKIASCKYWVSNMV